MEVLIAERKHKKTVIQLVADAFAKDPQIVHYTDGKRSKIELIASLAFEVCMKTNTIFITEDLNAVAVCHPSIHSESGLRVLWENMKFPMVFGIKPLHKMLAVEKDIVEKRRLPEKGLYLWLLATNPAYKGKGYGSVLLHYIHQMKGFEEVILETSNPLNIPFYEKRGFDKYDLLAPTNQLGIHFFTTKLKG